MIAHSLQNARSFCIFWVSNWCENFHEGMWIGKENCGMIG